MNAYMMVGPTKVIPAFFSAALRASDSGVLQEKHTIAGQECTAHLIMGGCWEMSNVCGHSSCTKLPEGMEQ